MEDGPGVGECPWARSSASEDQLEAGKKHGGGVVLSSEAIAECGETDSPTSCALALTCSQ